MLSDQALAAVLRRYGVQGNRGIYANPVTQIVAGDRVFALKEFEEPSGMRFQVEVAEHLQAQGYRNAIHFFPDAAGDPVVELAGRWYLLSPWVTGNKPDVSRKPELRRLVRELGRFHAKAEGLASEEKQPDYEITGERMQKRLADLRKWEARYRHPALQKAVEIGEAALAALNRDALQETEAREAASRAFVHGDYNYSNTVLTKKRRLMLIDLDAAAYQPRIADLIHLVQRNWGRDFAKARFLMHAYHDERPLTRHEWEVVAQAASFPAQFWRMLNIAHHKRKDIRDDHLAKWEERYLSERSAAAVRRMRRPAE